MVFKEGDILDIYLKPQSKEEMVGQAKLIQYVSTGLPFILNQPIVYNLEEWIVEIINSNVYPKGFQKKFKFRYIESLGIVHNQESEETKELLEDNFKLMPIDTSFWENRVDNSELNGDVF